MTRARAAAVLLAAASTSLLAQERPLFRASVDSVVVDVSVQQNGRPATDLTPADFALTDNGVRQTILDLSRETLPVDITLVVDVSGSMAGARFAALQHAIDEVTTRLRPIDRARLVTFNQRITDVGELARGRRARDLLGPNPAGGTTSLYDAIASSIITPLEPNRRHMAIVFTDGLDVSSFLDARDVVDVAARSGVTVFAVSLAETNVIFASGSGNALFRQLADTTGGVFVSVVRDEDLSQSFVRAFEEFGTSYVLRYSPSGTASKGWHDIAVRITRPGRYDVRARKGYFGD
jgi:VWFA-related protein